MKCNFKKSNKNHCCSYTHDEHFVECCIGYWDNQFNIFVLDSRKKPAVLYYGIKGKICHEWWLGGLKYTQSYWFEEINNEH
jgi:hypothetical protein